MKIKETLQNYRRVLQIAHKPSKDDFLKTVKICAIGMIVVGIIGFLLYLISVFVPI